MRVIIGCDHNGLALKEAVKGVLAQQGVEVEDAGCFSASSVDYPDIAQKVAGEVASGRFPQGVLICATGIGMSITANKVPGVRAALCHDVFSARQAREHNDANILCLGGAVIGPGPAREIITAFLNAGFQGLTLGGERHARRVQKIRDLEKGLSRGE